MGRHYRLKLVLLEHKKKKITMEINPLVSNITDLLQRTDALRRFL